MACFDQEMVMWKDFPKDLRVLLLDEDTTSAAETKSKLEAMDFIVFLYCNEKDALEAITSKTENFHVAIVEVTSNGIHGSFRFLEMAKDLPTIVISNVPCISTTLKCRALGEAEFLQKPLSEDKLRNIWQHVVHKAFNGRGDVLFKSLEPIEETIVSMLQLQSDKDETENEFQFESEINQKDQERAHLTTDELDILSAPSTPQLVKVKGGRFMERSDFCEQQTSHSLEKDDIEDKDSSVVKKYAHFKEVLTSNLKKAADEEEVDSTDGSRTEESIAVKEASQPLDTHDRDNIQSETDEPKKRKSSHVSTSFANGNQCSRKKIKVDWTPELHKKFVQAVEQLGIDQAIPSKILELMKVEDLTRHNIASHLQKYRMHRRPILPKDSDNRWQPQMNKNPMWRGCMPMVLPPFQSNYGLPPTQVYPVWGYPSYHHPGVPMWGYPGLSTSTWNQPQGNCLWKSYPGIQAEAWGRPAVPPYIQCSIPMQKDKVIDDIVKEAVSKPWLPLPLGLKPPSIDSVLAELHRQGIRTIPPISR